MLEQTSSGKPKSRYRLPKPYVAVWGVLATGAGSYLAVALAAPGLLGLPAHSAGVAASRMASNGGASQNSRRLQERLSRAQLEIAKLRTKLSRQQEVAAARAALKPVQTAQATQATQTADASQAVQPTLPRVNPVSTTTILNSQDTPGTRQVSKTAGAPVSEVAVAAAQIKEAAATGAKPTPSAIVTGSITVPPTPVRAPAPPISNSRVIGVPVPLPNGAPALKPGTAALAVPPPAVVAPPVVVAARPVESKVGVRLATGPSVDVLRLRWTTMLGSAGSVLAGLEPHVVASTTPGALGPTYDLIAGPLKTMSDAQRICNAAVVRASICEIRKLEGSRAM